jgi:hypothetical protein
MPLEDNETLQVWLGNKIVGWMLCFNGRELTDRPSNHVRLYDENRGSKYFDFPLSKRCRSISRMEICRFVEKPERIRKARQIPEYAHESVEHHQEETVTFAWAVLQVDRDQYEQIFDLDDFLPIDTGMDLGQYGLDPGNLTGQRYDIAWFDEASDIPDEFWKKALDGKFSAAVANDFEKASFFGDLANTPLTATAAANSSVLTSEKMLDAIKKAIPTSMPAPGAINSYMGIPIRTVPGLPENRVYFSKHKVIV